MMNKERFKKMEELLLKKPESKEGCPAYSGMIFMNKEKEKEWDNLEPGLKKFCLDHLQMCAKEMEVRAAVDLLSNILSDILKRLKKLKNEE
jgi:hypothetical protein